MTRGSKIRMWLVLPLPRRNLHQDPFFVGIKASGIHPADPNSAVSFQDCNYPPIHFLSSSPQNEQVILVGHSAGGSSVTDAIRTLPHKVHCDIYVAGNMSKHGLSTDALGPENPPTSVVYKKEFQRKLLYQMSPMEDSTLASMLLRPVPKMAFKDAKFDGVAEEVDGVRRVYVKMMSDRVVSEEKQDDMIRKWPPSQVFELDSGPQPFLFRALSSRPHSRGCSCIPFVRHGKL